MTTTLTTKMSLTKSGAILGVATDGVVTLEVGGTWSYMIASPTSDSQVAHFEDVGDDVSYETLYAAAKVVDPVLFP